MPFFLVTGGAGFIGSNIVVLGSSEKRIHWQTFKREQEQTKDAI
jgi:dTDP-D-glucose 4,6-dehydratase